MDKKIKTFLILCWTIGIFMILGLPFDALYASTIKDINVPYYSGMVPQKETASLSFQNPPLQVQQYFDIDVPAYQSFLGFYSFGHCRRHCCYCDDGPDDSPPSTVPIPATIWLFLSALIGMVTFERR